MKKNADAKAKKLKSIKLLIMDCDGVLTDGSLIYGSSGDEFKVFNVRDGHGLKLLKRAGIKSAIITSRSSVALKKRADELGIDYLYQGALTKVEAFDDLLKHAGIKASEAAYVGDDLVDIPVMIRVGLSFAVGDAVAEVKRIAHMAVKTPGGRGAVREVVEIILKNQGLWKKSIEQYHR